MITTALLWIALGALLLGAGLAPRAAALRARSVAEVVAVALLVSTGVTTLAACGQSAVRVQASAADAIARAVNAATPSLAEAYTVQGEQLVVAADSREEALALLDDHRERWRPVWGALDALAAVHDAWATALEEGAVSPALVAALREAWCALVRVVGDVGAELPELPGVACGGAS